MGGTTGLRPGQASLPSYKLWSPHCRPPRSLWTCPVAQSVKHPPAMQVLGLDPCVGKDPLEKGMATHSSILAWRIPWGAWWATVHGSRKELDTTERLAGIHTHRGVYSEHWVPSLAGPRLASWVAGLFPAFPGQIQWGCWDGHSPGVPFGALLL